MIKMVSLFLISSEQHSRILPWSFGRYPFVFETCNRSRVVNILTNDNPLDIITQVKTGGKSSCQLIGK